MCEEFPEWGREGSSPPCSDQRIYVCSQLNRFLCTSGMDFTAKGCAFHAVSLKTIDSPSILTASSVLNIQEYPECGLLLLKLFPLSVHILCGSSSNSFFVWTYLDVSCHQLVPKTPTPLLSRVLSVVCPSITSMKMKLLSFISIVIYFSLKMSLPIVSCSLSQISVLLPQISSVPPFSYFRSRPSHIWISFIACSYKAWLITSLLFPFCWSIVLLLLIPCALRLTFQFGIQCPALTAHLPFHFSLLFQSYLSMNPYLCYICIY